MSTCDPTVPSALSAYLQIPIKAKDDPHEEAFPIQIAVKPDPPSAGSLREIQNSQFRRRALEPWENPLNDF